MPILEARDRADSFVAHAYPERLIDLGEVRLNYATVGSADRPALLLVPSQTESWWGYEAALPLLEPHFQAYAVDLRGQGRSTWTPGRYTLDIWGNDLVRFIDMVIGRPTIVSGNSSGGVLATWLAAYAKPGQVRGALLEDPPLFASELTPAVGHSIRQGLGPLFATFNKWLGDQWTIGNWGGMQAAAPRELPAWIARLTASTTPSAEPPQNLKEYDPEWARAFVSGSVSASCDHARMLASVRAPVLLTHHFRAVDPVSGSQMGAISDEQAQRARELVTQAGQRCDYISMPDAAHQLHASDPETFCRVLLDWSGTL
jgi:pimeloyl-ACP methyl ester carboxylesterase